MSETHHLSVIGGGLAGLTAAVHAAQAGASVVCFEGAPLYGGLVANIGRLDDWPATQPVSGLAVAEHLLERTRELGVTMVTGPATSLVRADDGFEVTAGATAYRTRSTIIASGARLRKLDVPGEQPLAGRGVSQCDWCDGGLYRNQRVAVVGAGNAALQAALHLAGMCETVTVIARGHGLRARRDYVLKAAELPNIEFLWETRVDRIVGNDGVDGLALTSLADGACSEAPFAAVFVFAGVIPNLEFAPPELERDANGFAITDASCRSSMPGAFVVGAARRGNGGSLLAAMGDATTAAAAAIADLARSDLL